MLERLRIQNFKSWQDTGDIAFGSLTGFFGTNSSGKSSILQFLLMLKQTVESSDRSQILDLGDDSSYVELGTLHDILYKHEIPQELSFSVDWKPAHRFEVLNFDKEENKSRKFNGSLSFSSNIKQTSNSTHLKGFNYSVEKIEVGIQSMPTEGLLPQYKLTSKGFKTKTANTKKILSRTSKFYGFPTDFFYSLGRTDILASFMFELEQLFSKIFYLGPLREYPSRLYIWGGSKPTGVGNRGERSVAALLSSRTQGPTIDMGESQPKRTVEEHVAYWLKELRLIYSFKVQPIAPNRKEYEVRIQRTAESASVFLTDVGFGVSQILPVLVLLFYVPEGSTVILEQPEIHLHPAVQAGLADVFIDAIKRRKLQIILESHSEHLLQRLQRRMAEEIIEPDAVKLYFTSIEEGKSKLTPLQLDEYGNIHNWPAGFFGDAFAESAAKMKAEMKRKLKNQ
jgi:AAA15 family ATPase/GTPase